MYKDSTTTHLENLKLNWSQAHKNEIKQQSRQAQRGGGAGNQISICIRVLSYLESPADPFQRGGWVSFIPALHITVSRPHTRPRSPLRSFYQMLLWGCEDWTSECNLEANNISAFISWWCFFPLPTFLLKLDLISAKVNRWRYPNSWEDIRYWYLSRGERWGSGEEWKENNLTSKHLQELKNHISFGISSLQLLWPH